ncbi:DUF6602 domain-containing protein [Lonsdalea quercina]|uniref:DUF6602 domain-containing protein n=1 Tax=Lonsdalea quercina TaxID=71657 RepID=UPI0039757367
MIVEATELLSAFVKEEQDKLESINMPHMPTLGKAYEEITKHGIDQSFSIPKGLNLSVVSGFIRVGKEQLPNQIDCMLVKGKGEKYGLTDEYICDIENVLAIFEVKKTLNKDDFIDAYEHLAILRKKYSEYFSEKMDAMELRPNIDVASEIFSKLTGVSGPSNYDEIFSLDDENKVLFYSLVIEQLAPVTIIHGYGGYKSEKGLRDVFLDYLDEDSYIKNLTQKKKKEKEKNENSITMIRGINSFPTLITANEFSLVKTNGLPYSFSKERNKNDWAVIASGRDNQLGIMLELIWSKISIHFDISMPWGKDDHIEGLAPLLYAKVVKKDELLGWYYRSFELSAKKLKSFLPSKYEPLRVSNGAIHLIRKLPLMPDGYTINDENRDVFDKKGFDLDGVVEELISTSYFALNGSNLLTIHYTTYVCDFDEYGFIDSQFQRLKSWCDNNEMNTWLIRCIILS